MAVKRWGGGVLDWALSAVMVAGIAALLYSDVSGTPSWWRLIIQTFNILVMASVTFRTVTFRATADADGLRVRSGRRTLFLPWSDIAGATVGPGTMMRIRLVDRCPRKDVLVSWSGLRPPKRAAAELDAMVHDPSLRPC